MSVEPVRAGHIGGSTVLDVGSGSCPSTGTCCRARGEGMTFKAIWRSKGDEYTAVCLLEKKGWGGSQYGAIDIVDVQ